MADDVKIAVYRNGELSVPVKGDGGNEAVLALPLDRLLVKIVKIPSDVENPDEHLSGFFKSISPYPDEPIVVSHEIVRETESGRIVLACALPEGSTDDIAEALDIAKLNITRVDSLSIGALRSVWSRLAISDGSRRLLLVDDSSVASLFVFDGDCPVVVRAVSLDGDIKREAMFSLIEAESFAGYVALSEILVIGGMDCSALADLAPVRTIDVSEEDFYSGVAERSHDSASFNALPDSWREVLEETRFKTKFKRFVIGAFLIWIAILGVVVGVPKYYSYKADAQKEISKRHGVQYKKVRARKSQVESVKSASNYDFSALETLRVLASHIPENFVLKSWAFTKGDSLKFTGAVSDGAFNDVNLDALDFKDVLSGVTLSAETGNGDDDGKLFFTKVNPPNVKQGAKGVVSFAYECLFRSPEEEE